jgi:4-hydroxy-tetrahydrodipicolinate reductase
MTSPLRLIIAGAAGRMGKALIDAASIDAGMKVVAGTERADVSRGPTPFPVEADPMAAAAIGADVWIDFTTPAATLNALPHLAQAGIKAAVLGATGFTPEQQEQVNAAAAKLAIVQSGNFSLGVALLCALVERAAASLDQAWDIEILETHHRHKQDAPSGTALMLGKAAAVGRGQTLSDLQLPPHFGQSGPRQEGGIGFAVVRGGGVIGAHSAMFASAHETLTLSHEALDRGVFASGALAAARWVHQRPAGLYGIRDVLGL